MSRPNDLSTDQLAAFTERLQWADLISGGVVTASSGLLDGVLLWTAPDGSSWRTHLDSGLTTADPFTPHVSGQVPRLIRAADAEGLPDVREMPSPDGASMLTELNHNIAIRDVATDELRELTSDGSQARPWHANAQTLTLLSSVDVWSPDGTYVISAHVDRGDVGSFAVVDWLRFPVGLDERPAAVEGSPGRARASLAVIRVQDAATTRVDPACSGDFIVPIRWSADSRTVTVLTATNAGDLALHVVDAATGAATLVMQERVPVLFAYLAGILGPLTTPLPHDDGFGWLSDRDGDLRLYALSADGGLRALTPPRVNVASVLAPTDDAGLLLTARTDPERPYDVHVCRTDVRGRFDVLTREPGTHQAIAVPGARAFIHVHSSLTRAPRSDLHLRDREPVTITAADTSAVQALGRIAPEEFVVTAADGVTHLHGVLYRPAMLDPARPYPVIDVMYGGPQAAVHPNAYTDARRASDSPWTRHASMAEAFTTLGFAAVVLDARGTPGRGREFQAAATQGYGTVAVDDHVAALRALSATRPWLDASRAGAIGISFGGYHAARCGLLAPDVFTAVVAAAGPYDLRIVPTGWYESLLGSSWQDDPQAFADAGLVDRAGEFRAELLLVHGTADANVDLAHTMRFSDALVRAGRPHELLLLQNQTHQITGQHGIFALQQAARFFTRHLQPG